MVVYNGLRDHADAKQFAPSNSVMINKDTEDLSFAYVIFPTHDSESNPIRLYPVVSEQSAYRCLTGGGGCVKKCKG